MNVGRKKNKRQSGYVLLSIMLMITLMLLVLSIEMPRIAQQIKRDKEEELIHRGNEYKSAIRKFFRKFGRYPLSIEQLENTNNIRFLRKRYKDPFTGKDDWRLLHPGEVQINALNPQGAGAPGQPVGTSVSGIGQPAAFGSNQPASFATNPAPSPSVGPQTANVGANPASPGSNQGDPTQNNAGITPASSLPGAQGLGALSSGPQPGAGPIIGVSSISKLKSIKEINGKNHYNDWQFVYDPRMEVIGQPGAPGNTNTNPIGGATFNPGGQINPSGGPGQITPTGPGQINPNPNPPPPTNPPQPQIPN